MSSGKISTDKASPVQQESGLDALPFDPVKHRQEWLRGLADELDKIEPLMPIKFLPDGINYPQWVLNVEREFSLVMLPCADLKTPDFVITPKKWECYWGTCVKWPFG